MISLTTVLWTAAITLLFMAALDLKESMLDATKPKTRGYLSAEFVGFFIARCAVVALAEGIVSIFNLIVFGVTR